MTALQCTTSVTTPRWPPCYSSKLHMLELWLFDLESLLRFRLTTGSGSLDNSGASKPPTFVNRDMNATAGSNSGLLGGRGSCSSESDEQGGEE